MARTAHWRWTPKFTVWAQDRKGGEWTEQDYATEAEARKDMREYGGRYDGDGGALYQMQLRPKQGGDIIANIREGVWWEAPKKNGRGTRRSKARKGATARRKNTPKLPTAAQLKKLVEARGRYLYAVRYGAPVRVQINLMVKYEKALAPVLKRLEADFLSAENQRTLDDRAKAWNAKRIAGPGVDY